MKFKIAVIISIILHISIFTLAIFSPGIEAFGKGETVYYVDFIQMPGGGGGGGGAEAGSEGTDALIRSEAESKVEVSDASKGVRDLTVDKAESDPRLRFPDQDKKKKKSKENAKKIRPEKKKEELVSVIRKDKRDIKKSGNVSHRSNTTGSNIRIGTGSGGGSGTGTGPGTGSGSGYGVTFPYAYYIDAVKNKISSSWYNSLVTPGLRGKFVAIVYFKIFRNGRITDLRLEKMSGNDSLDLSALRAIENAAPFPPLPATFAYRYLGVHFEFEHNK
jgi:TonB family protein